MKRIFILMFGVILMMPSIYSQTGPPWTEDFDGNVTFTARPSGSWGVETRYYLPGSSTVNPRSYWGMVPNRVGDSIILETPSYDCTPYEYVMLRFSHICKISTSDIARIEYKLGSTSNWEILPAATYMGSASNYSTRFNAGSYPEWKAEDSTLFPSQSWWKEETFDLGFETKYAHVQFRFVLKHGSVQGTQASFGWLIDNFQLLAANNQLYPPTVQFVAPFVRDTAYGTGPWEINAKVKTRSNVGIIPPHLVYTATYNGVIVEADTLLMTNVRGDSLWKATIPQFIAGTEVLYSITGKDSIGNFAMATSGYFIAKGTGGDLILQDGSSNSDYFPPFLHNWGYSRSMSLYPAAEMEKQIAGQINTIALRVSQAGSGAFPMKVWLKTVPAAKTTWSSPADDFTWSVATQDATLVYDGLFHFSSTGWFDIPLTNTFIYNGMDNLVVMFEQNCGSSSCSSSGHMSTYSYYYYSSTATNTLWYNYNDYSPPTGNDPSITDYRPDLRISITGDVDPNSVALHSIDINDTIIVSSPAIPVIVTIKNKGDLSLDSTIVYYSVNGSAPQQYNWTGNLPWDFNAQATIGNYAPKLNGYDTIKVWVKMPNGVVDSTVYDDTLTKIIYGSTDILMAFVDPPVDTIRNTGPFEIKASIRTLSGVAIVPPINLVVTTTHNGVTTTETLPMTFNATDNLWKVFIPHKQFGSDVLYSITLTDGLVNVVVTKTDSFYVKALSCELTCVGNNNNDMRVPQTGNNSYTICSGIIYPDLGIASGYSGGYSNNCDGYTVLYPATAGTLIQISGAYETESGYDYIEIYDGVGTSGTLLGTYTGGNPTTIPTLTSTTGPITVYFYSDFMIATSSGGYIGFIFNVLAINPSTRLCVNTSVALDTIESPLSAEPTGGNVLIQVKIRNMGMDNLTDCDIYWKINSGGTVNHLPWTGDLPEDFTEIVALASYTPVPNQSDTIIVWVSMPNGVQDPVTTDDTSVSATYGCSGPMSGDYIIGAGETYTKVGDAINALRHCGVSSNIRFLLKSGTYNENWNFSNTGQYMGQYMLTVTSLAGNKDSVILAPVANSAVILSDAKNIRFEHITVNIETLPSVHGFVCGTTCENIIINNCAVLGDTATVPSSYALIALMNTGAPIQNITIKNNLLRGSYFGIITQGGSSTAFGSSNLIIDSNTVTHQYSYGIVIQYAHLTSLAHNTITSRTGSTNINPIWYGLYVYVSNGNIMANRIHQRSNSITSPYGIYSNYHNYYLANNSTALIANNEIILNTTETYYGIYVERSHAGIINNSIYISGSGAARGIYISNSTANNIVIKNNNIVLLSSSAYPIYFSGTGNLNLYTMDYNNYYSPTNIGYYGSAITSMATWRTTTLQDANSVNINPVFLNTANSLQLLNNTGLTAPVSLVNTDINGALRRTSTTMGAYELLTIGRDLMLLQLNPWSNEIVEGQTVKVNVEAINLGIPITTATFGWSLNGSEQLPDISWTANPVLGSLAQRTISIGSFVATGSDTFDVVVWIKTINGQLDTARWNDTLTAWTQVVPLAEFVEPFVGDTIGDLAFDVNVKILEGSGAIINTPEMYVYTESCNSTVHDTLIVPMVKEDDKWVAHIPKQYYNSTVVYEVHISDTVGNSLTLKNSTCIIFGGGGGGNIATVTDYSYTGSVQTVTLPAGTYELECWGANGGSSGYNNAGTGGYSKGTLTIRRKTTVFINVGGIPIYTGATGLQPGGYNGGGSGYASSTGRAGGGATHIATTNRGVLSNYDSYRNEVLIVAGGGGGDQNSGTIGHGGGLSGTGTYPGTQVGSSGSSVALQGTFGQGGNITTSWGGGGGGGWFGGGANQDNAGSGGSGYIGGVTNGITASLGGAGFVTNLVATGDGHVRITTISSGGGEAYDMPNNLAIFNLISPTNTDTTLCADLFTPVEIELSNLGQNDYDFTNDSITIGYEIINPKGIIYSGNISIDTGALFSEDAQAIELMSAMPVVAGSYSIKAWVTSAIDNFSCDDTLNCTYTSTMMPLPIDEDFSNTTFPGFVSIPVIGNETWGKYTDTTSHILPPSMNGGMLRYTGSFGTMARLSTRQLDLSGVVDPVLKFWYYHDTTASDFDKSYTDVNIIVDGIPTTVLSLNRKDTATGWKEYTVRLDSFTNAQCILIQFESMNRFDNNSAQYIGRITITSSPDLAVSGIIISPEATACDLTNKEVKVVLTTTVNQAMDLRNSGNSLTIQIGSQTPIIYPLSILIAGNSSETVSIAPNVDLTGVTNIKAYLTDPVDNNPVNDTATVPIDIRPKLAITVNSITGNKDCIKIGEHVQQEIVLENIGNVDLSGVRVTLFIAAGDNYTDTVYETETIDIQTGNTVTYTLKNSYLVPSESPYQVKVTAWLECAPGLIDVTNNATECVDLHNLLLIDVVNPPSNKIGETGSIDSVTVLLENTDQLKPFENVDIIALIEDKNGQVLDMLNGTVSRVDPSSSVTYTFMERYTVPNDSVYYIRVYLNSNDFYPEDDTLYRSRKTDYETGVTLLGKTNAFTLGQNIPNPANNSTRIDYSVPEAGEVIFHVHTISGQILYSKKISAERGAHSIELNTSTLSAGIYYYSIEYKGRRLVKQLGITK